MNENNFSHIFCSYLKCHYLNLDNFFLICIDALDIPTQMKDK